MIMKENHEKKGKEGEIKDNENHGGAKEMREKQNVSWRHCRLTMMTMFESWGEEKAGCM